MQVNRNPLERSSAREVRVRLPTVMNRGTTARPTPYSTAKPWISTRASASQSRATPMPAIAG
jgi:hypothetical protein